ncbi:SMI1/KNR4 family protein [Paenibacillus glycanilyticus]|uniref:SMI1/KNR4 family protein n=1 Tax=Paenibacillus glycanilyticus TaxID=126569 RepID=UPI00203DF165|nr:SMI1/KNR4 family protein [Paenibacillus glycanilyticus]MCM3631654.1 SMI1/KNR4 family protein [Paenibacillus glycanilyticus]
MEFTELIRKMKNAGVKFANGLTESEFEIIEQKYIVKFPPDLKQFLSIALPISDEFNNWRDMTDRNVQIIQERFNWCLEGMLFDIEHNNFWLKEWGNKPNDLESAKIICIEQFRRAPKLIPIYSHRYIPQIPQESGNPIFSVHQTDIIYYGENLKSYLMVEFDLKKYDEINFESIKRIPFWSDIIEIWEVD